MKMTRIHWTLFLLAMLLCLCTAAVCGADAIPANATDLTLNTPATASVSGNTMKWFRFVPEETTAYLFYPNAEAGTIGELYERDGEQMNLLRRHYASVGNTNFQIKKNTDCWD